MVCGDWNGYPATDKNGCMEREGLTIIRDPKSPPPLISLDVSKGEAHALSVVNAEDIVSGKKKLRTRRFLFTKSGLDTISQMRDEIIKARNDGEDPVVVMEFTGCYSKPVEHYCQEHGFRYAMVPPTMSNKTRENESVKAAKNDNVDCRYIAVSYFEHSIEDKAKDSDEMSKIQALNALRATQICLAKRLKQTFRNYLDLVFPRLDRISGLFLYSKAFPLTISQYPHPDLIPSQKRLSKAIMKNDRIHGPEYASDMAEKILSYLEDCYSGVSSGATEVSSLSYICSSLARSIDELNEIESKLFSASSNTSQYKRIQTIPGVGPIVASTITAACGDLKRFKKSGALESYLGIVPLTKASGTETGLHHQISHKGNTKARTVLYLAAQAAVSCSKDNVFRRFYARLTEGNNKRPALARTQALIAVAHKILTVMRAICINETDFDPSR